MSITTNLDPNGQGTIGSWLTIAGGSTNLQNEIDDYVGGGSHDSDTTGVQGPNNADSSMFVLLSDTDAGFDPATLATIQIKSAYRLNSAGVSGTADTCALFYQIFRSDETTAITTELSKGNITSGTYAEATDTLTLTGSHTKTDWDGARLRIRQDYTVAGCADTTTRLRVTAARIILTWGDVSGSGGVAGGGGALSGSGTETFTGTGSVAGGGGAISGSGTETFSGSGSVAGGGGAISGSASEEFTGTGAIAGGGGAISGTGSVTEGGGIDGSGAIAGGGGALAGSGAETFSGSGSIASGGGALAGSGAEAFSGTGAVAGPGGAIAGSGAEAFSGSGAVTAGGGAIAGSGDVVVPISGSGGVAAGGASMSGVGTVTFIGSGAIAAGGASILGNDFVEVFVPRLIRLQKYRQTKWLQGAAGRIAPVGAFGGIKGGPSFDTVRLPFVLSGTIAPASEVVGVTSGPSYVTYLKSVAGTLSFSSAVQTEYSPVIVDPLTGSGAGTINPTGSLATGIDPFTVTVLKSLVGRISPSSGQLNREILTVIITQSLAGAQIAPTGAVATLKSGPDLITVTKSVDGTITPASSISNDVTTPGSPNATQDLAGSVTPAGSLSGVIDPFTVTLLQSVAGTITPAGSPVSFFSNGTVTKAIAGTITPASAINNVKSGPDLITVTKAISGSIAPSAGISNVVVPPPITFFSVDLAATVTPHGAITNVKGGPSYVTVPYNAVGSLIQHGSVVGAVSGPSFVTIPKSVGASMGFSGSLTYSVGGPSYVTVPKAVSGEIAPSGAISSGSFTTVTKALSGSITPAAGVTSAVGGTGTTLTKSISGSITPISSTYSFASNVQIATNPMYPFMGGWELSEFNLAPQWPSIAFTSIQSGDTSAEWKTIFDGMRARGMKGGPAFTAKSVFTDLQADGTLKFNLTKYKSYVDMIANVTNIADYISGGECQLFCAADEPYHSKFGGTFTPDLQKQCVQYIKSKLPGIKTWYRSSYNKLSGSWLPTGGWGGYLDYGCLEYNGPLAGGGTGYTGLPPLDVYTQERTKLLSIGLGIIYGANWWNGGDGSSGIIGPEGLPMYTMTPTEIIACIDAALTVATNDAGKQWFFMWTDAHNTNLGGAAQMLALQDSASYMTAWNYVKSAGMARGSTNQTPVYYTNTSQQAAPYPPPTIAVGAALRDSLTNHKVFHLLDNARTQDAEYPSLNSDNSCLYFVQGGAGMLGDVTWSIPISTVQVGTVRNAFDVNYPGVVDGVIWDRGDRRYFYYLSGQAPLRIFRKDIRAGTTVVMKDFSGDPAFSTLWGAQTTSLLGSGLHSSRSQERFAGIVGSGLGVFVWNRLTQQTWNWLAPTGKTINRVTLDDSGQYIKTHFSDNTWQIVTLDVLGRYSQSAIITNADPPLRDDNQTNKMWQASKVAIKQWSMSTAQAAGTATYNYPKRSSKDDPYSRGRVSLQAVDEIIYADLHYAGALLSKAPSGNPMLAGMFNLTASEVGASPKWVSSVYTPSTTGLLTDLAAIRADKAKVFLNFAGSKASWFDSTSSANSLANWKARIDRFRNIDFNSYITDKTVCHYIIDEPNANGNVLPPSLVQQMIDYSRQLWPNFDTAIRMPSRYLITDGWGGQPAPASWPGLTYGWSQFTGPHGASNNMTPTQFYTQEVSRFATKNLKTVLGVNWLNGGDGSSGIIGPNAGTYWLMTPTEIRACTVAALPFTQCEFFIFWTHVYSTFSSPEFGVYETRADYVTEWNYAINQGQLRGGGSSSSSPWVVSNGEIYKMNWANELVADPNKLTPEVVRQGFTQLTKVSSLTNLTARGQWFYDATAQVLYVRCTDGLSPATKSMVVFDWRFGMEEIIMVNTNGTLKGRLCRHFSFVSNDTVDLNASRGPSVSYDGSRVLFTSNWGGHTTYGIYCALTDPRL